MTSKYRRMLAFGWALTLAAGAASGSAAQDLMFVSIGGLTRPPIGWVEFCADHPIECKVSERAARVVLANAPIDPCATTSG